MGIHIGIDIGGTKMMAAAVNAGMQVIRRCKAPTPEDLQAGLDQLHAMVAEVAAGEQILGIGLAIGGPIDLAAGTVSPLNQPQWRDVPLKRMLEDRYGCPFHYGVDTDVAAVAEYHLAGLDVARFLYVTISTGVGGGFLLDGKVYRGIHGIHPEVGHQSVAARVKYPERVLCGCGNTDCLEALVSGSGIQRIYGKPAQELDADEWDEVAFNLSQGLRNMIMPLAPDLIVLGGGVTTGGGEFFLDKTFAYLEKNLKLAVMPEIRISELGYDTALLGAAYIARGDG
ncbi:MAG TPA: ROK family protein [Bacteroidia bacterium]|nr:ROK family protein [Bacteroidia bacterium]